ncbi:MAG: hypothetical protein JWO42_411 [Chloroflexi bacterium]|nr:hypothetical protein [Chloroflexota bacterium]
MFLSMLSNLYMLDRIRKVNFSSGLTIKSPSRTVGFVGRVDIFSVHLERLARG